MRFLVRLFNRSSLGRLRRENWLKPTKKQPHLGFSFFAFLRLFAANFYRLALWFQKAEADEELVHFLDAVSVVLFPVPGGPALVKESMLSSGVDMQIASPTGIFDRLLEGDSGAHGDEIVVVAQQKEGRRWREYIVHGREGFPELFDPLVPVAVDAVVDYGIEKEEGIGPGRDLLVVAGVIEPVAKGRCRCEVSACRPATHGESMWIDAEGLRVRLHVANGALGVDQADIGWHGVRSAGPILGANGNHAPLGQVFCLGREMADVASVPATAKKEEGTR